MHNKSVVVSMKIKLIYFKLSNRESLEIGCQISFGSDSGKRLEERVYQNLKGFCTQITSQAVTYLFCIKAANTGNHR